MSLPAVSNYTDLQGLEGIRRRADSNPEETLRFAAQQFEALFLQMMLKSARDAKLDDGLFDSEQTEFYQDLYDKQMGINLSQGQGIGIADLLVQQLRRDQGVTPSTSSTPVSPQAMAIDRIHALRARATPQATSAAAEVASSAEPGRAATARMSSPEDFVATLWPQARQAAETLGVDPAVLLAQAALETGWGRAISTRVDGSSSFNLFNIKADERWSGERVSIATREYRDGGFVREQAQFRAYGSYAESFADYVDFLQRSTRYQPALAANGDSRRFVTELARAGYATDPDYAEKVIGIIDGEPMANALSRLPR